MRIQDTLGFLLGTWALSRSYADHRSGAHGTFNGQAVLALITPAGTDPALERARYEEAGQLCLGSYLAPAARRLEYRRRPGGTLMTYRPGGEPFVPVDLASGTWQAGYPCGGDQYEIRVVVRSADVVEESWRVRGPAKDYTAVATLSRVAWMPAAR
jgi:Family of unknown function (DUF6314)